MSKQQQYIALMACMLVTFVLGSVHAFSVFLVALEQVLDASRSRISLIYSLALVFITLTVLIGHRIYTSASPAVIVASACIGAAAGLWIASGMANWWWLLLGYSVLFGCANGVGYGFTLQLSARVMPEYKGFAMGAVTAAYAVGSILFALVLSALTETQSVGLAFRLMAVILIVAGLISGFMIANSRAAYTVDRAALSTAKVETSTVAVFWLCYFSSVFAGLMAIGHAAGIVLAKGGATDTAVMGAMVVGIGSGAGGFLIGWCLDRWPLKRFLIGLPVLSAIALIALLWIKQLSVLILVMGIIGFSYGSIIAVYPYAISRRFGDRLGPKIYGQVFTAWGLAGLAAPWLAGILFDLNGNYTMAMLSAATIALGSALAVLWSGIAE